MSLLKRLGLRISQDHLPQAVEYDAAELRLLEDDVLVRLMIECVEWRIGIEEAGKQLLTAPARTVWNALVVAEIDVVKHAHRRVAAEHRSRG